MDDSILSILQEVCDPEVPVLSIIDLGIVQRAVIEGDAVTIDIIPTYTGCPAMDMIKVNIIATLQNHGYHDTRVNLVLTPAWSTDMLSVEGHAKLLAYGIAPPVEKTSDKSYLFDENKIVMCPQCKSSDTRLLSQFGSTACKAMYVCNDCREPFDYFKCH